MHARHASRSRGMHDRRIPDPLAAVASRSRQGVTPETRPGLWPPASTRGLQFLHQGPRRSPEAMRAAKDPVWRPQHPNREPGLIPGGWAGPTNLPSDETPAGRVLRHPEPFGAFLGIGAYFGCPGSPAFCRHVRKSLAQSSSPSWHPHW